MSLLLTNVGELVTNVSAPDDLLGLVSGAAIAISEDRVAWVGSADHIPPAYHDWVRIDCEGRAALPGFVDAHTHAVFAGDRAGEFARRLAGASYADILEDGGGIHSTVAATRAASTNDLVAESLPRLRRMLVAGTTTAEVKSGYGLDVATEKRMLEAVAALAIQLPLDLVPTFLGAHVVPAEYREDRSGYLHLIEAEALPACAPLARFCDVFCDEGAFTPAEARRVLTAAARHGLRPRLHADQLAHSGGSRLAAELGAASADHLDHADAADLAALREAGTVAVLLPGVSLSMRTAPPPARRVWDSGVTVALATDCNPGTAWVESMQLVTALASLEGGLTPAEAVWAATRGGALALEEPDKGQLTPGAIADVVVLDAPSHVHIPYRPGANLAWKVIKRGNVVTA